MTVGFLACWLGTLMSRARGGQRSFEELQVRARTGLGAEPSAEPTAAGKA